MASLLNVSRQRSPGVLDFHRTGSKQDSYSHAAGSSRQNKLYIAPALEQANAKDPRPEVNLTIGLPIEDSVTTSLHMFSEPVLPTTSSQFVPAQFIVRNQFSSGHREEPVWSETRHCKNPLIVKTR